MREENEEKFLLPSVLLFNAYIRTKTNFKQYFGRHAQEVKYLQNKFMDEAKRRRKEKIKNRNTRT